MQRGTLQRPIEGEKKKKAARVESAAAIGFLACSHLYIGHTNPLAHDVILLGNKTRRRVSAVAVGLPAISRCRETE